MSARETGRLASASRHSEEARTALARRYGGPGEHPALRRDLVIRRVVQMGEAKIVVKSPDPLEYYSFEEGAWGLLELFDGTRTRSEIQAEYVRRHPEDPIELSVVFDYEGQLTEMHLLERTAGEKSLALFSLTREARQKAADEKAEGFNPFFILFHVFDPDPLLNRTVRFVRWFWSPPVVIASLFFFAWTVGVFVQHWQPLWAGTIELYAFLKKPFLDAVQFFLILSVIGFVHEMSHAYVTKMYGGEVHDIGIALLYFTPAFYCNTTDSLLFQNKWHSMWVTTAGIYVEAWIGTIATFLWVVAYPDTLLSELAFKTMLFTGASTVFFNINPLIKIDGYYALTALLEISELREESFAYIGARVQHDIFRLPVEVPQASSRKRRIYWIYGLAALAWVGVIMTFIGGLFYNFYARYFGEFALVLCALTLARVFKKRLKLVTRTGRLFYLDKKELLMSPRKRRPVLVAAAVALVVLLVPWSRRRISVESVLRPETSVRLEAPEDATVAEVHAREGEVVRAGAPLFRLESKVVANDEARDASAMERMHRSVNVARERGRASEAFEAGQREASAAVALESERSREGKLEVRSPIAGRMLTSRTEDLLGRYVTKGTLIAEVGSVGRLLADLPVTERLVQDIGPGSPVRAYIPQQPLRAIQGRVLRLSAATLDGTRTAGRSDPAAPPSSPDKVVAVAVFENADGILKPGALVRAKIYGERTSYGARSWRVLRDWFRRIAW
ncbi:MAG: HlyD family efflux transporter periplasmic adaptor subunit [Acidobacteriota bacterium]